MRSDGGGAIITPAAPSSHGGVRQGAHRGKSGRRDADDERQLWRARNAAGDEADRLVVIELRRFAHDAENGATVGASGDIVVDHAVDAGLVDPAVGEKRRGRDWKDAFGVDRKHGIRLGSKGWRDDGGRAALLASEGEWRKFPGLSYIEAATSIPPDHAREKAMKESRSLSSANDRSARRRHLIARASTVSSTRPAWTLW